MAGGEAGRNGRATTVEVDGRRLALSNLDKVLYPATATTKAGVLSYYTRIAPVLLPHLAHRPVTLVRAPDGVDGHSFFEKRLPRGAPSWMSTIPVPTHPGRPASPAKGKPPEPPIDYPAVDSLPALVWLVNMATLELHVPMWRVGARRQLLRPDLLVFDLDPGAPAAMADCCAVALLLREALASDGLAPLAKTSGSKGVQLYARRPPRGGPADTLDYAHDLAEELAHEHQASVVANMRKDLRRGKVLIDWSQNQPAKTTVAPYSLRLRERPWVSTPVSWQEVEEVAGGDDPERLRFEPDAVVARVEAEGDLFAPLLGEDR